MADFRAGHAASLNFLKGQVMKLSQGKANPGLVGEILARKTEGVAAAVSAAVAWPDAPSCGGDSCLDNCFALALRRSGGDDASCSIAAAVLCRAKRPACSNSPTMRPRVAPIITLIEYGPDCLEERRDVECDELLVHLNNELVTWINIDGLGDLSVLRILGERFNLHPLALEDVLDTGQRPKVEQYDDYLFIVAKMIYLDNENEISAEQVSMFLGKTFLITLQEEPDRDVFEPVRARIRSGKGRIRKAAAPITWPMPCSTPSSITTIPVLESIGTEIDTIEDELVDNPLVRPVGSLHEHKRTLTQIRRMVWPLRDVTNLLLHEEPGLIRSGDQGLSARLL